MSETPEEIVRALAASPPLVHSSDGDPEDPRPYSQCGSCEEYDPDGPSHHLPTCLWRRAYEWVEVNP